MPFYAIVDDKETCGRWGGAEEDRRETGVDAADCLAEGEFGCCGGGGRVARFLETGLYRV